MGSEPRTGLRRIFDYHHVKGAVNRYLLDKAGGAQRPVFHDIGSVCPELAGLTRRHAEITREYEGVLARFPELPQYHDVDPGEREISESGDGRRWNVFLLHLMGFEPRVARATCPQTLAALSRIPNLLQAFFSILEPRKQVPVHEGPYYGYLRYQLGLRVPDRRPPTLRVAGQSYTWREGEAVLFDDSWPHEVRNESDQERAILIVDVLRPLPRPAATVNRFMTQTVARNTYGRGVARRANRWARAPRAVGR